MRIFCAVRHSNDPRYYYGDLWSRNFYPALRQLGHEVIESQTDLFPTSCFMHIGDDFTPKELGERGRTTEALLGEIQLEQQKKPLDLFLSYFYSAHFDPAGFDRIRQLGIPSVNFFCNSMYQFELVRMQAPKVDFAWHAERDADALYKAVGANPVWVQMGADPSVYHPIGGQARERISSFVGQRYADRDRLAAELICANMPLALYGPGWGGAPGKAIKEDAGQEKEHLGRRLHAAGSREAYFEVIRRNWSKNGFLSGTLRTWEQLRYRRQSRRLTPLLAKHARGLVPFDEQKKIFASSEVVLNFSNVWADGRPGSNLISHVRLRDFEAPMCRTCYLTGDSDEIRAFYEVGKEIDTYATKEELVDKTRFYLTNSNAAEKLRDAGYRRARRDHTWVRRFEELFHKIGLN
jgi:spore maturation protein CgeB